MHRNGTTLLTCAVLVSLVLVSAIPSLAAKRDKPVKVFVTCKGGSNPPTTRVEPETVEVDQDQNVEVEAPYQQLE